MKTHLASFFLTVLIASTSASTTFAGGFLNRIRGSQMLMNSKDCNTYTRTTYSNRLFNPKALQLNQSCSLDLSPIQFEQSYCVVNSTQCTQVSDPKTYSSPDTKNDDFDYKIRETIKALLQKELPMTESEANAFVNQEIFKRQ